MTYHQFLQWNQMTSNELNDEQSKQLPYDSMTRLDFGFELIQINRRIFLQVIEHFFIPYETNLVELNRP